MQLEGERRLATVILADVKGSTALAERVGTEDWVEIMNHVLQILGSEIYRFGGEVDQFRGDCVVAFFGATTAHEDDPERAMLASLAMQEAIRTYASELAEREGIELLLRVGVNTGEVIAARIGDRRQHSEDTAMGQAIALADRLQTAAEPGTVLVSENTYRLVQPLFEWEVLGEITVKGVSHPVPVYRPLAHRALPGKARGIPGLASPLVGRRAEFRALQEAVERLRAGVGGVVTLVGEAGIGKSRLVAELRKQASADLQWVEGRCLSYGTSIAYLLWLDVLRGLLGVTGEDPPVTVHDVLRERVQALCLERFETVCPYLGRLMSLPPEAEAEATLRGLDGESLKFGTFRAVETLIECSARQQPLVIVSEDLHWADPTSVELLEQLLALTDRAPLLLICVFRPETEHGSWRLRETAARLYRHRHTDLWLDPLSAAGSEALVGNLLQVEGLPQRLKERILSRAEGNPFYVEEIIRSLMDSGAIVRDEATGRWEAAWDVADVAIPDTLYGVLMARIDRLQKEAKRVLQLAAVIGRIFLYRILAAIAREERELDEHLLTLQQEEMIRERARVPELEYIFKHQLTREAAYNGLLKKERRVFHRQVAEMLEQLFPDRIEEQVGLLAYHWHRAGDPERARYYARLAGEQAATQFANTEAVNYFSHALDLTPETDHAERYTLLLAREKVYDVQGARESQTQDLAALHALAEVLDDDRRRAEVALRWTNYAYVTGDYRAAISAAWAAIRLAQAAQDVGSEAAGYLHWGRALRRQGIYKVARHRLEQALSLSKTAGSRRVEADSLRNLGGVSLDQGDYVGPKAYLEQALRIFHEIGDRRGESAVLNNLGAVSAEQADYARAKAYFEQALRIYREIGDRWGEGVTLSNLGSQVSRHLSDYATAQAYCEQALGICRAIGDREGEAFALYNLGVASQGMYDYAGARAYEEQALRIFREIGYREGEGAALAYLGHVTADQGDYTGARLCYERALRIFRQTGSRWGECLGLTLLSLLFHHLGEDEAAREHSQQALLIAQETGNRSDQGYALTNLGHALTSLGHLTEAADAYRRALALRQELGQHNLAMESRAGLAHVSLAQGDLTQAQAQVEEISSYLESNTLDGTDEPFRVYLTCYRVLHANQDPRAGDILNTAHRLLRERAARISDEELRRSFLENVAAHREIVSEFANQRIGE